MSRICFGIVLLGIAGACSAQAQVGPGGQGGPQIGEQANQGTDADVRQAAQDPHSVEIPLYAGAKVSDVIRSLVEKGFHITWDPEKISPTMILLERPNSTRVDNLLNEILKPWGMRADHNLRDGGYRVRELKKKKPAD